MLTLLNSRPCLKRYIGLCLAFFYLSNIYILSIIWENNRMNAPDILLGKALNESTDLLLLVKKY